MLRCRNLLGVFMVFLQRCGREASEANTTSSVLERDASNMTTPTVSSPAEPVNIAAIVAPVVIVGFLVIAGIIGLVVFLKIREKRQTEGTYRPSSEEQAGARVQPNALKLPPGERLI
ncbi:protein crumbs homolog 3-like isoform X1 [Polyodon spathula]|uniref:protein crumbs homolog 3-like isoform X1 n=2 Tax=Polyodon spathula TaxID=7913 RepID=UPI001B7EFE9D|nr:protein crumbs homolog 3-like isoform X1 [Polyodon spathula]XP_041091727.1 protein crumbs homolog 3-like isoform X1 [Polyodon spathula]